MVVANAAEGLRRALDLLAPQLLLAQLDDVDAAGQRGVQQRFGVATARHRLADEVEPRRAQPLAPQRAACLGWSQAHGSKLSCMARSGTSSSYDAVVVGGGVIGLSCAWRAARRGARVALVERSRPPAGATRVAAGMLAPVGELAFGEPELLKMTLAAAELYPEFVAELEAASGLEAGYRSDGALHVALDRDEAAELRRVHELQRSLGLGAEWLPPRRCRELEPGLTPSFNGGVHAPGEGSIDPRALTAALLAALAGQEGVELRTESGVEAALLDGERIAGVRTESGEELRAAATVLAAGAWSGQAEWLPEAARPAGASGQGPDPRAALPRRRRSRAAASSPPSGSTWCRAPTAA